MHGGHDSFPSSHASHYLGHSVQDSKKASLYVLRGLEYVLVHRIATASDETTRGEGETGELARVSP